ncbi:hypothetical protein ANN_12600 [Periplaneta americana]|uniref:CHK kinase-like domain-containing protein n=1 Tax=Periplaneta americana TaxID=6978 RepID=A0ABQ8TH26_PERAM|nr:hypothetical protein ANN_12600 [Periplaneta americana]
MAAISYGDPNNEPYNIIVHGDMWVSNFMFHYPSQTANGSPDEMCFLDFQHCRYTSPGADLEDCSSRRQTNQLGMLIAKIFFRSYHDSVVVITEDVQNVHLLLEYRPHIDVSLACKHDPKLQEYCVCPENMPQFDSQGIPNQAPETNKPMILNGPTSRNREGSDQVSVEAKQLGHLYLSIEPETFDPSTGEPYD